MRLTGKGAAVVNRALRPANWLLDKIERGLRGRVPDSLPYPPIFIVGPPRSGTTLVYQTLVTVFDVGYLTNLHALLYGGAGLVDAIMPRRRTYSAVEFESTFGRVQGLEAPSEAGAFWYRWFPRGDEYAELPPDGSLRRVVGRMICRRGRPFVFKNVFNSIRVRALAASIPEARFIVVRRSIKWTAQSIYLARQDVMGDVSRWWSVPVPGKAELGRASPEIQVVEQACRILESLSRDAELIGRDKFYWLHYEDFCRDPRTAVSSIMKWLASSNVHIGQRQPAPPAFPIRSVVRVPPESWKAIERAAQSRCDGADRELSGDAASRS